MQAPPEVLGFADRFMRRWMSSCHFATTRTSPQFACLNTRDQLVDERARSRDNSTDATRENWSIGRN